jgi:cobalamin biosynthesis protein CbiD
MARHVLTKLKAAECQIRTACDVYFLHGDLVSVMTLAGAAEEICGNLLQRKGTTNILGIMHEESKRQGLNLTEETVYARASKLRNALKHAKSSREDKFTFDDEAAVLMLVRAVINFQLCGRALPPEAEKFIGWVRQHGLLSFHVA